MATSQTIPFFAPDGSLVDVPYDQLAAARANKGVIAVRVKGPDGEVHLVPSTRIPEATSKENGGQLLPYEQQEVEHPGFWSSVLEDAFAVPKGIIGSLPPIKAYESIKHGIAEYHALRDSGKTIEQGDNEQLKNEGYGPLYRWLGRPIAQEGAGVNAAAMEQSAREGDEAGVWGHTAVPTVMSAAPIVGEAAARLGGKIPGAGKAVSAASDVLHEVATPENIATAIGGAAGIKLGGALGGIEGGAIGKTIGRALAKRLAQRKAEAVYPGANSPTATQSQLYPYLKEGPDPGASLPAAPTPEQLNPALLSPARTLPGQIPPELTPEGYGMVYRAQQDIAAPLPPRTGLSLPPGPEADPTPTSAPETIGSATEPEVESTRVPSPESIPRTLSGESALRRILTGQDNANLLKIAKSRGLNVTRESQLRPGFADNLLINKIINDMNPEELQHVRDTFLEVGRNRHQFGDIGPEAYKTMSLQTYFPEVKTSLAQQLRTRRAVEQNPARATAPIEETQQTSKPAPAEIPEGASDDNLLDLLKQSLAKAKEKPSTPIQEGEQSRPFVDQESSTTYGKKNKLVSEEAATAARKNLRTKLFRSNMGLDPTAIADAVKLGTYHVEAGLREFGAWSKQMVDELGPEIRPHLKSLWEQVRPFELTSPEPDAPMFYSKASHIVEEKVGGAAPGDSILATLRNNGVKAQEIEWTGLDDFLAGKKKVTKTELQQFIKDNQIKLEESNGTTKYEDYSLDGPTSNYTEMLLRLPGDEKLRGLQDAFDRADSVRQEYLAAGRTMPGDVEIRFQDAQQALRKATGAQSPHTQFKSAHFEEPNILAHIRFDERPTPGANRTLFLEEVQSDWHQAGKKRGYAKTEPYFEVTANGKPISANQTRAQAEATLEQMKKAVYAPRLTPPDLQIRQSGTYRTSGGVPDAPFKSDWHELAIKRMLRHAAENSYDRMAWTTGEQQAARYDLSKHIDRLEYEPEDGRLLGFDAKGTEVINKHMEPSELPDYIGKDPAEKLQKRIEDYNPASEKDYEIMYDEDSGDYFLRWAGSSDGIEDAIDTGSEREMENSMHQDLEYRHSENPKPSLGNLDLKIGGEWAKALYDRAIPNFLNKYAKKWGAKVSETEVTSGANARIEEPNTPQYPEEKFQVHWRDNNGDTHIEGFRFRKDAEAYAEHRNQPQKVHSIEITPAMKKSVLKEGQPIARREELQPSEFASA